MSVITITSDLGTSDYYLAALKGCILKSYNQAQIIDLNCHIPLFQVAQAAYSIGEAYRFFPEGSIHIAHVAPDFKKPNILIAVCQGQYFISFDNGFLSMLPTEFSREVYALRREFLNVKDLFFSSAFAFIIKHLSEHKPLNLIADLFDGFERNSWGTALITNNILKGRVIATDSFGNLITNISKGIFEKYVENKKFTIAIKQVRLLEIKQYYSDVKEAELLAMFNSSNLLEIAIFKGNAKKLVGLKIDDTVIVSVS